MKLGQQLLEEFERQQKSIQELVVAERINAIKQENEKIIQQFNTNNPDFKFLNVFLIIPSREKFRVIFNKPLSLEVKEIEHPEIYLGFKIKDVTFVIFREEEKESYYYCCPLSKQGLRFRFDCDAKYLGFYKFLKDSACC